MGCTDDSCDPETDACINSPNDGLCDNGVFCDGAETCDAVLDCQAGTPPICDDGVSCTVDSCDEVSDACVYTPDDAPCDNGVFCDGAETCDPTLGCQPGTPPTCDDGVGCTDDSCDAETDACVHMPNDALCDNGLYCDGVELCHGLLDCRVGIPPDCDDGVACTVDSCDEDLDACVHTADDALCDDGVFCDGIETCDPVVGCLAGTSPCGDEAWCDEAEEMCVAYGDGDFDGDGDVDLFDYHRFMLCFGQLAVGGCEPGNMSGDEFIDLEDYAEFGAALTGP